MRFRRTSPRSPRCWQVPRTLTLVLILAAVLGACEGQPPRPAPGSPRVQSVCEPARRVPCPETDPVSTRKVQTLLASLSQPTGPSPDVVISRLVSMGPPAVAPLAKHLDTALRAPGGGPERLAVVSALGLLRGACAEPSIRALVSRGEVSTPVLRALVELGSPGAVCVASRALLAAAPAGSAELPARLAALAEGDRPAARAARDALMELCGRAACPQVRAASCRAVSGLGHVRALLRVAVEDPDPVVRLEALDALHGKVHGRDVEVLARALEDPFIPAVAAAAEALGASRDPNAIPRLIDALGRGVAMGPVVDALVALDAREAVEPISRLVDGSDHYLAAQALEAVARLAEPWFVRDVVCHALEVDHGIVQRAAARVAREARIHEALPALRDLARSAKDPRTRRTARVVLGELLTPK